MNARQEMNCETSSQRASSDPSDACGIVHPHHRCGAGDLSFLSMGCYTAWATKSFEGVVTVSVQSEPMSMNEVNTKTGE